MRTRKNKTTAVEEYPHHPYHVQHQPQNTAQRDILHPGGVYAATGNASLQYVASQ